MVPFQARPFCSRESILLKDFLTIAENVVAILCSYVMLIQVLISSTNFISNMQLWLFSFCSCILRQISEVVIFQIAN